MNIEQVKTVLEIRMRRLRQGRPARPILLMGPPGTAKSSAVRQVADHLGIALIDIRGAQLDPVDLRGLPAACEGRTVWLPNGELPDEGRDGRHGILLFDEVAQAPQTVQNAMLQLTLDRRLGPYRLPDGWLVVLAGNRDVDRAGAGRLTTALGNRVNVIQVEVDPGAWRRWARANDIHPDVVDFISVRSNLLSAFDPGNLVNATPRSWEAVSEVLAERHRPDIEHELIGGWVGSGPAADFAAFRANRPDLPDINRIAAGVDEPVINRPDVHFATALALATKAKASNFDRIMIWVQAKLGQEYAATFVRQVHDRLGPEQFRQITDASSVFQEWVAASGHRILAA